MNKTQRNFQIEAAKPSLLVRSVNWISALSLFGVVQLEASIALSSTAPASTASHFVLTDSKLARRFDSKPIANDDQSNVSLIRLTDSELEKLSLIAHEENGACAGYEKLNAKSESEANEIAQSSFRSFRAQKLRDEKHVKAVSSQKSSRALAQDPRIMDALSKVSETNLRATVDFLSTMKSRNHRSADGQNASDAFMKRIDSTIKDAFTASRAIPYSLEQIQHSSTPMKSIRLTFTGSKSPRDVIVLGGHLDSINQSFFGPKLAPGADDNASGSANVLEVARILASSGVQPERTLEFYWYAGEEGGLLGSAEIASDAKSAAQQGRKNILGVIQLDMTLFPGSGEFTLGSMTDFTSQDMRDRLKVANDQYVFAKVVEDKCGYGCSDHASWYRNGFSTLMPFEAMKDDMNRNIHSERDTNSTALNYRHSAMFSKLALAIILGW